jgi:hypothetical protein
MITKTQLEASLTLNERNINECYIRIGKLLADRADDKFCGYEAYGELGNVEIIRKIDEEKRKIEFFKGERKSLEWVKLYSQELYGTEIKL